MADPNTYEPEYPWYAIAYSDDPLEQGDLISGCPIVVPPRALSLDDVEQGQPLEFGVEKFNVVILSQSCDLVLNKLDYVLVSPYVELAVLPEDHPLATKKNKEEARRGNMPSFHMLNECHVEGHKFGLAYVSFKDVFAISNQLIRKLAADCETRVRLLPPYREHLAQAFARFFMRVGLPEDIPAFR